MSRSRIEKLAIANRGEVAVRIIRACQEMGIETVLLHSEADMKTLAYRLANERICIGPSPVGESYLSIPNVLAGAKAAGADAVHPGFGFLSENADFAEACERERLIFVGPSAPSIRLFGDKIAAKDFVAAAGGRILPDYRGEEQDLDRLLHEARRIGFPLMVKVAGGGGGRGIRVIHAEAEAREAILSAQREGRFSFGSERVLLEKYLDRAKHIEVQVFGGADGRAYHLFERDCSVQRRHQKLIEEAGAPLLPDHVRDELVSVALRLTERAGYRGAGTIEFLVQDAQFYFLEMNTRLQVEHPVTEMVLGIDLVKAQILTAEGRPAIWDQEALVVRGHSIECRICAEDPYANGQPSIGVLGACQWPVGPGRRFEIGFTEGDEVTSYYDSMIAKVIVHDENRPRAIAKMRATLAETVIFGVKTNIPFLQSILKHPDFVSGAMTTRFLESEFPSGLTLQKPSPKVERIFSALASEPSGSLSVARSTADPWQHRWGAPT